MQLRRDIGIGFLNSLWTAVVNIACAPAYVHFLGAEAYGVIAFFVTTQALLQLLDMGLSTTMNREAARCIATGHQTQAGRLLKSLSMLYWIVAAAIAGSMLLLAGPISTRWLQAEHLSNQELENSVMLLGLVIACRWPIGLYQGVLLGALRVGVASSINMLMVTLANGGALVVLAHYSTTLEAFFLWQAAVALLYALTLRRAAWRALGTTNTKAIDTAELIRVARLALGMSAVAATGVVLAQLDKLILSRLLTLEDFGHYALAGLVAGGLYLVLAPTFNVIFPRMSGFVAKQDHAGLVEFYRTGSRLLCVVLFPMAATAAAFAPELLVLWTRDPRVAGNASLVAGFLLIGTALNGAMHFPYALQLACGETRLTLTINIILLAVMLPLTTGLALKFGATGGAVAWLLLNLSYLLFGTWMTHRRMLRGLAGRWLLADVGAPAVLSSLVILIASAGIRRLDMSAGATLSLGCLVGVACVVGLSLMTQRTRTVVGALWRVSGERAVT